MFAGTASSPLMKVLFAARFCKPDLLVAIAHLASKVSTWQAFYDRAFRWLYQHIARHAGLEHVGCLDVRDLEDCRLVMSPDADLEWDLETAKSTSGFWVEMQSADGERCWPTAWRSKRQGGTASSTCEAEYISMIALLVARKTFECPDCRLVYQESALDKGDVFTKKLGPATYVWGRYRPTRS